MTKLVFDEIKDQNPLGKALAISKCLEGLIGFGAGICGKVIKEDSNCDTLITQNVCNGLELAKSLLGQVNSLIEKARDGLSEQLFAFACSQIDKLAALLGVVAQNQSPQENQLALSSEGDTVALVNLGTAIAEPLPIDNNTLAEARNELEILIGQL